MNREIKFRGLSINRTWHYGLLAHTENKKVCHVTGWFICNSEGSPFAYQIRPETIGQFTGLHDKNGVEIYEGDIVKMMGGYAGDLTTKEFNVLVEYINDGFTATSELPYLFPDHAWYDGCEVIGNIYQNPELLTTSIPDKTEKV